MPHDSDSASAQGSDDSRSVDSRHREEAWVPGCTTDDDDEVLDWSAEECSPCKPRAPVRKLPQ